MVEWLERLGWRKSPESREFEPGLHHPTTGKLSLYQRSSTSVMGTNFETGKDKISEGNGRIPPFICCS